MEKKAIYNPDCELELIQRAAEGNREAYAVIYRHYLPRLYKYLYDITRNKEDSEEILQDIFLKLWEKKEDLIEVKALSGYLFSIARNKLMNRYDHQKVERKAIDYITHHKPEARSVTEDHYTYTQYSEVVQRAINALPPKRRQVFEMSTQQELSHDEIARQMNISKSMVKKQLYAANNYVKEYLQLHAGLTTSIALVTTMLLQNKL